MVAGYEVEAARPHVLAGLFLAGASSPRHMPIGYRVLVAAAPSERWVEVTCSCEGIASQQWPDEGDATYSQVLAQAWLARHCAVSTA